jgi:hypothetical protein
MQAVWALPDCRQGGFNSGPGFSVALQRSDHPFIAALTREKSKRQKYHCDVVTESSKEVVSGQLSVACVSRASVKTEWESAVPVTWLVET